MRRTRVQMVIIWVGLVLATLFTLIVLPVLYVTSMPGHSYQGPSSLSLSPEQTRLGEELRSHVETLSGAVGERNLENVGSLSQASRFLEGSLQAIGYKVRKLPFDVEGRTVENLEVEIQGGVQANEIVVFGAHYDSEVGTPGANDNASGVAALLALCRLAQGQKFARTLRFVFFVNEEPPYFQTEAMGSLVYATALKQSGVNVVGMVSLETLGYYSAKRGSQKYPFPFDLFYPDTGNFVAFVGNLGSRSLVRQAIGVFRERAAFPSEGAAAPAGIPGVGWSDHWSFWQVGYPAIMVTDTAVYRYPHYHRPNDIASELDYERMAFVTWGLNEVLGDLAGRIAPSRN